MKRQAGIFVVVAAVMVFATTVVEAQNRGNRGGRGDRGGLGGADPAEMVKRMFENDANSDGKLSADELGERGSRMMDRADANSDGFLTKDEVTKMMESRGGGSRGQRDGGQRDGGQRDEEGGRRRGAGGPGGGPGGGMMSRMLEMLPLMKALDKDGNGELSEEEINNAVKAIKTLDKDKNGKISSEEMMPDMPFGRGGGRGGGGRDRGRPQRPERDGDSISLKQGQTAPDFELKSLDGKTQTKLSDLYAKKPVVLFFGSYT